jgi:hypothetical protein
LSDATFVLPFVPRWTLVNAEHQLCLAQSSNELRLTATGSQILQRAKVNLNVLSLPDTAWIRATHHYTAPDDGQAAANGWRLSGTRFWEIHADLPTGTEIRGVFPYNGNPALAYNDYDLLLVNDDSLALLWRPGPQSPWQEYPSYSRIVQGPTSGLIAANQLRPGQYTLANVAVQTGVAPAAHVSRRVKVLVKPNPVDRIVVLYSDQALPFHRIQISAMDGTPVVVQRQPDASMARISVDELPAGQYLVTVWGDGWQATEKMTKVK